MPFPDQRPDSLLVALAARGDKEAFSALYRRHRVYVARVAQRYSADQHEAMDIVQETFICLYRKVPTLRLTAKLTTYLYPIVKNIALSRRRKMRGRALMPEDDRAAPAAAGEAGPGGGEGLRAIERAVAGLPEGQREVVLLRFVDDMQLREIAAALDIPVGTVKSRLFEAIRTMRAQPGMADLFGAEEIAGAEDAGAGNSGTALGGDGGGAVGGAGAGGGGMGGGRGGRPETVPRGGSGEPP